LPEKVKSLPGGREAEASRKVRAGFSKTRKSASFEMLFLRAARHILEKI